MNVVAMPVPWRAFPHVIVQSGRRNRRYPVWLKRSGPVGTETYSFAHPDLLDAAGDLTGTGIAMIRSHAADRARRAELRTCVVWAEDACTWFAPDGEAIDGRSPPQGDPVDPFDYAHVPATIEDCFYLQLPDRAAGPFLCLRRIGADCLEVSLGDRVVLGCLDEPPSPGGEDPAAGLIDEAGDLVAPPTYRGARVEEVRHDWILHGPVQPMERGELLRGAWPDEIAEACERVAGLKLDERQHAAIRRHLDPVDPWMVLTGVREAA